MISPITDGDLRRMLESEESVSQLTAVHIMNKKPKNIDSSALAVDALTLMRKYSITQLVVMDGLRYKGMIHLHDIVKEGII